MKKLAKTLVILSIVSLYPHLNLKAQELCSMDSPTALISTGKALSKISQLLKKSGISKVPSTTSALKSNTTSSSSFGDSISIQTVSGTPPTLVSIPGLGVKTLFWKGSVVEAIANGTATDEQCNEFFGSMTDGASGGFGSCNMAEAVGHSFQNIVSSEISLCYMKNVVKKQNFTAGGVTVIKGKLPKDTTTLFAPSSKQKIIKVSKEKFSEEELDEAIYIKIPSLSQNQSKGFLYRAEIYFCPEGVGKARGYNTIQVNKNGQMKILMGDDSSIAGRSSGSNSFLVEGYLTPSNGSISWDPARSRHSVINSIRLDNTFKSEFYITSDNLIVLKDRFQSLGAFSKLGKNYSISHFSGTDASNVSFLEGGYKGEHQFGEHSNSFSGAAEYRDTFYASSPNNDLYDQASSYDVTNDSFYSSAPEVEFDGDSYTCSSKADLELMMVKGNTTLEESLSPCFKQEQNFQSMDFCRNDPTIQQAQQNFESVCGSRRRPPQR